MNTSIEYLWAPWCMECKAMAPHVDLIAAEFATSVDLVKINLAESPEVAARLNVMATPTIIGREGERELFRVTGRRTPAEIRKLFAAAAAQSDDISVGSADRALRVGSGAALALIGVFLGPAWPLVGAGTGIVIWGMAAGAHR